MQFMTATSISSRHFSTIGRQTRQYHCSIEVFLQVAQAIHQPFVTLQSQCFFVRGTYRKTISTRGSIRLEALTHLDSPRLYLGVIFSLHDFAHCYDISSDGGLTARRWSVVEHGFQQLVEVRLDDFIVRDGAVRIPDEKQVEGVPAGGKAFTAKEGHGSWKGVCGGAKGETAL